MLNKPTSILIFAGLFIMGVATGSVVTYGWLRHAEQRRGLARMQERHAAMERFPERQVDRLSSVLELTSAQREKILEITRQAGAELDRLRRESWAETQQRVQKMNEAIRAVLTPDQLPKFDAFRKEQSERMHRFFPDRRDGRRWPPRNEHGPGGSPPPPPPPEES